jgi:predicted secreted protein
MKGKVFVGIIFLGIVLLAGAMLLKYSSFTHSTTDGTSITNPPNNQVPPAPNKYLVTATAEDFSKEANITKQVEVKVGDTFTITLDSNATTGFQWNEQAQIADTEVLTQEAHQYVVPATNNGSTPAVGMTGVEEWTFTVGQTGTTTATFSYDRPWEGGEKGVRTFELTVVVQ